MRPVTPHLRAAPSLMRYAPAFVLLAIAIADAARVADPDLWGHIAFGRLFLRLGPVRHDPFNYSVPGHEWAVHEWLAELIMARTYDAFGILGLKLWKFSCTALTIILLAMAAAETGAEPPLQAALLIAAAVALMPLMQFRPQLYTYIFLSALMVLLARENYRGRARLWLVVPMLALWANLHGGFVIGVFVLAIYTGVVSIESLVARRGLRRCVRLSAATIACAVATIANPYGLDAWSHVLGALNDPVTRKVMVDWQPLIPVLMNSRGPHSGFVFFALVVAMLMLLALAFILTPRGGDLALVAIATVMGAAAFDVVRNMPLATIAAVTPLARHLHLLGNKIRTALASDSPATQPDLITVVLDSDSVAASESAAGTRVSATVVPDSPNVAPAPVTAAIHSAAVVASEPAIVSPAPATAAPESAIVEPSHFNSAGQIVIIAAALILLLGKGGLLDSRIPAAMDYPVGAIAFMRSHQLLGNLLARFEWGQYVIFHMAPPPKFVDGSVDLPARSSRIFIDARVDLVYPPRVINEYLDFSIGAPGGARLLDNYPHDYILMPTGSPADITVSARADWTAIYRDQVAVLFARTNSLAAHSRGLPATHLAGSPNKATAPTSSFP
jgi:hypothetical protein